MTADEPQRTGELAEVLSATMRRTYGPRVMHESGQRQPLFRLDYQEGLFARNYRQPVLVSATSGAGSSLPIALQAGQLRDVGIDLVAQATNELLASGAEPLFFMDRLSMHQLQVEQAGELLTGIAEGCTQANCSMIGGTTSESPDLHRPGELDVAGFAVGVADRRRVVSGEDVSTQDVAVGLPSNGLHADGVALARHVLLEEAGHEPNDYLPTVGRTVAQELLQPTRVYARPVVSLLHKYKHKRPVRGIAPIAQGGLVGSLERMLPTGCGVVLRQGTWPIPPIYEYLQTRGLSAGKMPGLFNMGLGMVLIIRRAYADSAMSYLRKHGETPVLLGRVRRSATAVELRGPR